MKEEEINILKASLDKLKEETCAESDSLKGSLRKMRDEMNVEIESWKQSFVSKKVEFGQLNDRYEDRSIEIENIRKKLKDALEENSRLRTENTKLKNGSKVEEPGEEVVDESLVSENLMNELNETITALTGALEVVNKRLDYHERVLTTSKQLPLPQPLQQPQSSPPQHQREQPHPPLPQHQPQQQQPKQPPAQLKMVPGSKLYSKSHLHMTLVITDSTPGKIQRSHIIENIDKTGVSTIQTISWSDSRGNCLLCPQTTLRHKTATGGSHCRHKRPHEGCL